MNAQYFSNPYYQGLGGGYMPHQNMYMHKYNANPGFSRPETVFGQDHQGNINQKTNAESFPKEGNNFDNSYDSENV